jgi:transcriptional regulator with XRE-family HTH domain
MTTDSSTKKTRPRQPGFAERLSKVLEEDRRSVMAIAREVGCSEAALRQWAAGDAEPPVYQLARLCAVTGVSLDWLVNGEGPRKAEEVVRESRTEYQLRSASSVDYNLLHAIVQQVEESLGEARLELAAAKRAELVVALYELFRERGHVDRPTIMRLVKLAM